MRNEESRHLKTGSKNEKVLVWCRDETVALALAWHLHHLVFAQATLYFGKRVANRIKGLHDHELGQQMICVNADSCFNKINISLPISSINAASQDLTLAQVSGDS